MLKAELVLDTITLEYSSAKMVATAAPMVTDDAANAHPSRSLPASHAAASTASTAMAAKTLGTNPRLATSPVQTTKPATVSAAPTLVARARRATRSWSSPLVLMARNVAPERSDRATNVTPVHRP